MSLPTFKRVGEPTYFKGFPMNLIVYLVGPLLPVLILAMILVANGHGAIGLVLFFSFLGFGYWWFLTLKKRGKKFIFNLRVRYFNKVSSFSNKRPSLIKRIREI